jgi:hypothetical protein
MGLPISGAWSRKYQRQVPYADARVWGTGINPVHALRGDPGRPYHANLDANDMGFRTKAEFVTSPDFIQTRAPWGYDPDDIAGLDVFADPEAAVVGIPFDQDGWPSWDGGIQDGQSTPVNRASIATWEQRPLGASGRFRNFIRGIRGGAHDNDRWVSNQVPTETVSEGWINKAASGMDMGEVPDDNVLPPSEAQLYRGTSMQQRYLQLNNDRSLERGTDQPRTSIPSRLAPMKLKVYSGEERHYDMFPYQGDVIPRPFYYRTAGTGPEEYLRSNDQYPRTALQRTPPPDPSMGTPDTELSANDPAYGYSEEDIGYY